MASTATWTWSADSQPNDARSKLSTMLRICPMVTPPEEGGGMVMIS